MLVFWGKCMSPPKQTSRFYLPSMFAFRPSFYLFNWSGRGGQSGRVLRLRLEEDYIICLVKSVKKLSRQPTHPIYYSHEVCRIDSSGSVVWYGKQNFSNSDPYVSATHVALIITVMRLITVFCGVFSVASWSANREFFLHQDLIKNVWPSSLFTVVPSLFLITIASLIKRLNLYILLGTNDPSFPPSDNMILVHYGGRWLQCCQWFFPARSGYYTATSHFVHLKFMFLQPRDPIY